MRSLFLPVAAAALASCSANLGPPEPPSPQAQARLQQLIAGRSAGPAVSCLPRGRGSDMTVVGDGTVVFRSGNTVYVNDMRGGCPNLRSHYALVTRQSGGGGLCSGEIAEVIDPASGISVSSCSFGEFVPYRRMGG
jgi:hypothetical protein